MTNLAASQGSLHRSQVHRSVDGSRHSVPYLRSCHSESVAYSRPDQNWEFHAELLVMPAPSSAGADSAFGVNPAIWPSHRRSPCVTTVDRTLKTIVY